jgi:hypothetical protein
MKNFNFIPAIQFDKLFESPLIIFYGSSVGYYELNGVKYIVDNGFHVATKNGKKVTYNPNVDLYQPVKKLIKQL